MISRRTILRGGAAIAATGVLPGFVTNPVWAAANIQLGQTSVDVLSDGHLVLPVNLLFDGIPEKELQPMLKKYKITGNTVKPDCNLTLIRDGQNTVLFDVGAGPDFMSSAGKLGEAMEAIKLDPADVTHVVFTHAHPDHLWGVLDEFDEPVFPDARHMIARTERDYWLDPKTIETIGEARQAFAAGAARRLKMMEDRISFFKAGEEILPGIFARNAAGHTPGHTGFEVSAGGERLMIVGDAIGNDYVSFEKPQWLAGMDQDQELGAKTRVSLLDQIASEKMMMIGFHLPYPGIGRAEKTGNAYRFVAA